MKKLILAFLVMHSTTCFAAVWTSSGGGLDFVAIGKPGFLKIKGDTPGKYPKGDLKVENGSASGVFTVDLSALNTHIELRDEHMKEKYLEVAKYPEAKLELKPIAITDANLKSDIKSDFTGNLTLKNVTKEIKGHFEYDSKTLTATAKFSIKISDFNIAVPSYMGVVVSDSVDVNAVVQLKK